jgi:hypothetical protein
MPLRELARRNTLQHPYLFRMARREDANAIVSVYESVFGKGGIKAPGHEQYPEPDVFTPEGVVRIAHDRSRRFIVAEFDGRIVGGMIVNFLSPYNCEFACVCVDRAFQGRGISPLLLAHARAMADQSVLTINSTEIVTHSVLSQTAHNAVGYNKVTGFGYCQYQHVFFLRHPESCLWISDIRGRVVDRLTTDRSSPQTSASDSEFLSEPERSLQHALSAPRSVFLPRDYETIGSTIAQQFSEIISYRINCHDSLADDALAAQHIKVELPHDAPYAYLKFPSGLYGGWQNNIDAALATIAAAGKRYIQARIPANSTSAISYAEYMRSKDFVLLGFLPLYSYKQNQDGQPSFDDLLVLQWIADDVVKNNALPGETDSVIKLYGYPDNLTGSLLKIIRREIAGSRSRINAIG